MDGRRAGAAGWRGWKLGNQLGNWNSVGENVFLDLLGSLAGSKNLSDINEKKQTPQILLHFYIHEVHASLPENEDPKK